MLLRDGVSLCDKKVLQHDRDAHYAELSATKHTHVWS